MFIFFFLPLSLPIPLTMSSKLIYDVSIRNHVTFLCNHDSAHTQMSHFELSVCVCMNTFIIRKHAYVLSEFIRFPSEVTNENRSLRQL